MANETYIILRESKIDEAHAFLLNDSDLDFRGGGDKTFGVLLNLTTDGDTPIRARLCMWRIDQTMHDRLLTKVTARGYVVNTNQGNNDLSWYRVRNWTLQEALDDLTRKPAALKIVGLE